MLLVCILCVTNCILLYNVKTKYNANRTAATIARKIEASYKVMPDQYDELPERFVSFRVYMWQSVGNKLVMLFVGSSSKRNN